MVSKKSNQQKNIKEGGAVVKPLPPLPAIPSSPDTQLLNNNNHNKSYKGLSTEILNYLERLSSQSSNNDNSTTVTPTQNNFYLITSHEQVATTNGQIRSGVVNILFGESSPLKLNYLYDLIGANDNIILKDCLELIHYFTTTANPKGEIVKRIHVQIEVEKKNSKLIASNISLLGFDETSFTNNSYEDIYYPLLFEADKKNPIWDKPKKRYEILIKELMKNNVEIIRQTLKAMLLFRELDAVQGEGRSFEIKNLKVLEDFEMLMGLETGIIKRLLLDTYKSINQFHYEISRFLAEIYHSILNFLVYTLNNILRNSINDSDKQKSSIIIKSKYIDYNPFVVKDPEAVLKSGVMGKMFIHEVVMSSLITKLELHKSDPEITEINSSNLLLFQKLLECEQNPVSLSTFCSTNSSTSTTIQKDMYTLTVKHSYGVHDIVHYDFFDSLIYESNCLYKSILHHLKVPFLSDYYENKWSYLNRDFQAIESIFNINTVCVMMVQLSKVENVEDEKQYLFNQLCSIGISNCLNILSTQSSINDNNRGRDESFIPPTVSETPPDYYTATNTHPPQQLEQNQHHSISMSNIDNHYVGVNKSTTGIPPKPKPQMVKIYDHFLHNVYTMKNEPFQTLISLIYSHEDDPFHPLDNGPVFAFNQQFCLLLKNNDSYDYNYDLLKLLYGYHIALSTDQTLFQFDDNRYLRIKGLLQTSIFELLGSFLKQYSTIDDNGQFGVEYTQIIESMTYIIFLAIENISIHLSKRSSEKMIGELTKLLNVLYPLMSKPIVWGTGKMLTSLASTMVHLTNPRVKVSVVDSIVNRSLVNVLVDCLVNVLVDCIDPLDTQKSSQIILILFLICRLPNRFKYVAQHLCKLNRNHLVLPFRKLLRSKKIDQLTDMLNEDWKNIKYQRNNHQSRMVSKSSSKNVPIDDGEDSIIQNNVGDDIDNEEYDNQPGYLEFDEDDDDEDGDQIVDVYPEEEFDDDYDDYDEEEEYDYDYDEDDYQQSQNGSSICISFSS